MLNNVASLFPRDDAPHARSGGTQREEIPPRFLQALESIRTAKVPRGLTLTEMSAPHMADYCAALTSSSTASTDDGHPLSQGRLIILHSPGGQPEWGGDLRLIMLATGRIDDSMGMDPLLGEVAWSWLVDSLDMSKAGYHSLVGSVSRDGTQAFGGLELLDTHGRVEVRASWTPVSPDIAPHIEAWLALLQLCAGADPMGVYGPHDLCGVAGA